MDEHTFTWLSPPHPNCVLFGPREPRELSPYCEAGLLPVSPAPEKSGVLLGPKSGELLGPGEGLGEAGRKGKGLRGGTQRTLLPSTAEIEPLPPSPDAASCLPHLITEMSSPEGSLLLLTVLLYFPPAASAAILARRGRPVGLTEPSRLSVNSVVDPTEASTNGRRESQKRGSGKSNHWDEEAGLRRQALKPRRACSLLALWEL